jgi:hypothetical protein
LKKLAVIVLLFVGGYYWYQQQGPDIQLENIPLENIAYEGTLTVKNPPIQKKLDGHAQQIRAGRYTITPLASFQAAARVLGIKHYRINREAELSPVDLALGWGPMTEQAVLDTLLITQSGRFYYWRTEDFPISRQEIEINSANMHLIPANLAVEKQLKEINEGDQIKFKGFLVRVDADDGWHWVSSMTRNDTGSGSCELILVDDITRL